MIYRKNAKPEEPPVKPNYSATILTTISLAFFMAAGLVADLFDMIGTSIFLVVCALIVGGYGLAVFRDR